jgi:hypothetical protein
MAAGWLAAGQPGGSGSAAGRIALVALTVLAVGVFAVLQIKARSRGRRPGRRYDPSDWRALPPPSWPGGPDGEAPSGREDRYRPDWKYGYPPGYEPYPLYDPARSPWVARDDAAGDARPPGGTRSRARRPS